MKSLDHCPTLETLIDLSYGEMEPLEAGPVQSHLETCAECALEWQSLLSAQQLVGELPVGPVMPSPQVELRLAAIVASRQPLLDRLTRRLWDQLWGMVSSPVPAYKAMLGGAVIALVVQLLIGSSQAVSPTLSQPARAPDPRAATIRIQPIQDVNQQPFPRQELEQSVDAIPPDHYAQVF